ncbi:MAG: 2OG-Fe(II) oxygenase [Gammaproteobacteria bacterium]|nr:MAG: 2OG-Fe(II) oxygenase [Gammaproteobacteria bacterium]
MSAETYALKEVKPNSFIYEVSNALPGDVCREMIRRFEAHPEQQYEGRLGQAQVRESSIKRTTDLRISGNEDWKDIDSLLFRSLATALREVTVEFPFFGVNKFRDMGYQLQRYREGEFYEWHVDGGPGEFSQRQLVALWYLNDVQGPGGETEFSLQDVKVTPQEGKLVLFPPFWTHIHRSAPVQKGVKYIATTWVCFAE